MLREEHIPSDWSLGRQEEHSTAAGEEEHSLGHLVEDKRRAKRQEEGRIVAVDPVEGRRGSLDCAVVVGKGWSSNPEEEGGCRLGEHIHTGGFLEVAHSRIVAAVADIVVLGTS